MILYKSGVFISGINVPRKHRFQSKASERLGSRGSDSVPAIFCFVDKHLMLCTSLWRCTYEVAVRRCDVASSVDKQVEFKLPAKGGAQKSPAMWSGGTHCQKGSAQKRGKL